MSWDIYGNPLRRGHCEVHPHVHEEYPCSVCMAESRANRQHDDRLQQEHNAHLELEYVKHQRDELLTALEYAISQVPELATVPGIAAAISSVKGSTPVAGADE